MTTRTTPAVATAAVFLFIFLSLPFYTIEATIAGEGFTPYLRLDGTYDTTENNAEHRLSRV